MFNFAPRRQSGPAGARGWRAYAVGDIHGRLDLLEELLDKIHADIARRPSRKVLLVFVGDLIDRGPSSAQVVERLRTYRHPGVRPMFLLGNHEEVLLRILKGESELITKWRWFGGAECLASYGVDRDRLASLTDEEALRQGKGAVRDCRHRRRGDPRLDLQGAAGLFRAMDRAIGAFRRRRAAVGCDDRRAGAEEGGLASRSFSRPSLRSEHRARLSARTGCARCW